MASGPDFAAAAAERYDTETLRAAWRAGAEFGYGYERAMLDNHLGNYGPVQTGALVIDLARRTVTHLTEGRIGLSPREWGVLEVLAASRGAVVQAGAILAVVWGPGRGELHYVRMYVGYLRAKLGGEYITNEYGTGYRLAMLPVEEAA